ncbi:response regulator [Paenibacillus harenae]|uniref:response regulator n=1 Tax=Paenibacillus harenae TaxID=306543 RepID=UPI0004210BAD|nr:response regulator [Paenibacillus harenae]
MIRVIAIDDEQPALRRVGKLLQEMEGVRVNGLFDSPRLLLEYVLTTAEPIDLAFLDIEMQGMNGVELARRLSEVRPEIHIAFLTAHEEYARDAFEVEALDYLLKPIVEDDLARTLKRFEKRSSRREGAESSPERRLAVRSFGPFSVTTAEGEPVRFRNSKGRELLAYLHHARGKSVSKAQILDSLWEDRDVERAQVNLHSTVYQLRKDLEAGGLHGIVEQMKTAGGSYCLRWPALLDDDVAEYEKACLQYESANSLTHLIRAIRLYGDGFLAGSGYGWAAPRQAELELSHIKLLEVMADVYVKQNRHEMALDPMRKLVHLLPLDERLHAKMVALLLLMNRNEDALAYYKLMVDLLDDAEDSSMLDFTRLSANPASMF